MKFRTDEKEYTGATAVEIVSQLARDTAGFVAQSGDAFYEFLQWSLAELGDRVPQRELDLSPRVSDEILARGYLALRHDYGIGEFTE